MLLARTIRAPVHEVYGAWTDPARLRLWFGRPEARVTSVNGELAEGSSYRILMLHGRHQIEFEWRFLEIRVDERLRLAWCLLGDGERPVHRSFVSISFEPVGPTTLVTLTHQGFSDPCDSDTQSPRRTDSTSELPPPLGGWQRAGQRPE